MSISSISQQAAQRFSTYGFPSRNQNQDSLSPQEKEQLATSTNRNMQTSALLISEDSTEKSESAKSEKKSDKKSKEEALVAEQNLNKQGTVLVNGSNERKQRGIDATGIDIRI
ncbi:hypothetical protein [Azotosporobacter soli]|uniref:hypothetical protein n=1 Tax=Azotosporobacter soli TaxID=3055040 RepID=UPI0031FF3D7A